MKNTVKLLFTIIYLSLASCATAQKPPQIAYKIDETAEKMLVYQLSNGGWPKQLVDKSVVNYDKPIDDELLAKIKSTPAKNATIDNKATSREITALVKAYKNTSNPAYLKAAEKGIEYLLEAQYTNGGWPQYYPDNSSYRAEITFNDDAMINVLNIMLNISNQTNDFEIVNPKLAIKATEALKKGVDCIVKSQVLQNGKPSIWAAQYDHQTLKPAKARAFEPASLSTAESAGIVKFLIKLENPSDAVKSAIENAITWFDSSKIVGYKFDQFPDGKDRGLIADPSSIIWARFYEFETNKPIFGDRDNSIKYNVADISFERRKGYSWYGTWANSLIQKEYPKWQKANQ
ncbi:MAG: pectate lyase [Flavobacterium sp.]|nr:MAG: pectate lyase [Flavobacterium sp.]